MVQSSFRETDDNLVLENFFLTVYLSKQGLDIDEFEFLCPEKNWRIFVAKTTPM